MTFDGLAFPTVRVRFAGATDHHGARWVAACERGGHRVSLTRPYDHALASGAVNARPAAEACLAKSGADPAEFVAIPGDLDADSYVYTFVPTHLLGR